MTGRQAIEPSSPSNRPEGLWARHASTRRDIVRVGYDAYRWLEQRVSPSVTVPRGGYPPTPLLQSGATNSGRIALTFDDGPHPEQTPHLLDLLRSKKVRATFYVLGQHARRHPDIVRRAFDEGHEIGTHTWSHRFLTTQTSKSILQELRSTDEAIEDITKVRPTTLRPPYGATTRPLAAWLAHEFGYRTVLWSVDSKDYDGAATSQQITTKVLGEVAPGSIVLAHDPLPQTLFAMPDVLDRLVERGFEFATIDELISSS